MNENQFLTSMKKLYEELRGRFDELNLVNSEVAASEKTLRQSREAYEAMYQEHEKKRSGLIEIRSEIQRLQSEAMTMMIQHLADDHDA